MSTLKTINVQHPSASSAGLILDASNNVATQPGTAAAPAIYPTGDSNTGIYSPGANRLGFTTDGAQRGEFDASGNFQFNSGYGSVATAYGCRAWVNFNGTGAVAIRADGNVSSITDNGTGDYTVNFDVALTDADYSVIGLPSGPYRTSAGQSAFCAVDSATALTTSAVRIGVSQPGGSTANAYDSASVFVAVFR